MEARGMGSGRGKGECKKDRELVQYLEVGTSVYCLHTVPAAVESVWMLTRARMFAEIPDKYQHQTSP